MSTEYVNAQQLNELLESQQYNALFSHDQNKKVFDAINAINVAKTQSSGRTSEQKTKDQVYKYLCRLENLLSSTLVGEETKYLLLKYIGNAAFSSQIKTFTTLTDDVKNGLHLLLNPPLQIQCGDQLVCADLGYNVNALNQPVPASKDQLIARVSMLVFFRVVTPISTPDVFSQLYSHILPGITQALFSKILTKEYALQLQSNPSFFDPLFNEAYTLIQKCAQINKIDPSSAKFIEFIDGQLQRLYVEQFLARNPSYRVPSSLDQLIQQYTIVAQQKLSTLQAMQIATEIAEREMDAMDAAHPQQQLPLSPVDTYIHPGPLAPEVVEILTRRQVNQLQDTSAIIRSLAQSYDAELAALQAKLEKDEQAQLQLQQKLSKVVSDVQALEQTLASNQQKLVQKTSELTQERANLQLLQDELRAARAEKEKGNVQQLQEDIKQQKELVVNIQQTADMYQERIKELEKQLQTIEDTPMVDMNESKTECYTRRVGEWNTMSDEAIAEDLRCNFGESCDINDLSKNGRCVKSTPRDSIVYINGEQRLLTGAMKAQIEQSIIERIKQASQPKTQSLLSLSSALSQAQSRRLPPTILQQQQQLQSRRRMI